ILQCVPGKEIIIDNIRLPFRAPRNLVRAKLDNTHTEHNEDFWVDNGFVGYRRDIYDQLESKNTYFFLNYDENDLLAEVEVHKCKRIKLFDMEFNFTDELDLIADEISHHSPVTEKEAGNYFFKGLNICIMDERRMGGEDNNILGYFSCSAGKTQTKNI
ncbi:MAG: hypothetical protein J7578_09070, partial [Chitinophagaceae bacterium]|nr:hypothetical protein [Chitinophagaceae bacterium]